MSRGGSPPGRRGGAGVRPGGRGGSRPPGSNASPTRGGCLRVLALLPVLLALAAIRGFRP